MIEAIDADDRVKIEAMLRRGKTAAEIARYTGFREEHIRHIRFMMPMGLERRTRGDGSAPSERVAPNQEYREFYARTARSSRALLEAIRRAEVSA